MTHVEVLERTRSYVHENFLYTRPDYHLQDDQRLMEAGVIDSMGVLELLEFLQDEFGIEIEDSEITERNLGSLRAIARYVTGKRVPSTNGAKT